MPNFCAAFACSNNSARHPEKSFFRFPIANSALVETWVRALRRENFTPTKNSRLCSDHFKDDDFIVIPGCRRTLRDGVIPTIFNFPTHLQTKVTSRRKLKRDLPLSDGVDVHEEEMLVTCDDLSSEHGYSANLDTTLMNLQTRNKALQKKVKNLGKKMKRKEEQVLKLKDLLADLKKKHLLDTDPAAVMEKCFNGNILDIVKGEFQNASKSPHGRRYSQVVKQFAATLHYYSPQAYEFCRTVLSLPHSSSIQNWLGNIDCNPGFLSNVIDTCAESLCKDYSLVLDSMSIMKQTSYSNGKFTGFCDYGGLIAEDADRLCTEALVFLLVPLQYSQLQYPVAYFLVDKINSTVQCELVKTLLALTAKKGIKIRNITCDGAAANQTMLSALGCTLDPTNPVPYFKHPQLGHRVYGTLDICHMLKLARNALAEYGTFYCSDLPSQRICWQYVPDLSALQDNLGLHLGTKITSQHINWRKHKMKVKLAAQVFSCSVADALQYLTETGTEGFQETGATVEFIRQMNRAFDVLNSKSKFGTEYKAPLREENLPSVDQVYQEFSQYLLGLEDPTHVPIYLSRRKTFVVGFICTFKALLMLADDLFQVGYTYLPTFRVSQDFIETLFSKIRRMGGHSDNPTATGFRAALRKLLMKQSVSSSSCANAMDTQSNSGLFAFQWCKRRSPIPDPTEEELPSVLVESLPSCGVLKENILGYMAGYIVRGLRGSIKCDNCLSYLSYTSSATCSYGDHSSYTSLPGSRLMAIKNRGGLICPTDPVIHILVRGEQIFTQYVTEQFLSKPNPAGRLLSLFSCSYYEDRPSSIFSYACEIEEGQLGHSHQLVRHVAEKFFDIRLKHYTRCYNRNRVHKHGKDRSRLNRLVIFKHQ